MGNLDKGWKPPHLVSGLLKHFQGMALGNCTVQSLACVVQSHPRGVDQLAAVLERTSSCWHARDKLRSCGPHQTEDLFPGR